MNVKRKYKAHEITCTVCGSLLEIEAGDVIEDDTGHLGRHHNGTNCSCTCSVCRNLMPLNSTDLPKHWIPVIFD